MISVDLNESILDFSQIDIDEEKVVVIDNLFPDWFIDYTHRKIIDSSGWRFGHLTATRNPDAEIPAFSQKIYPDALSPIAGDTMFPMIYHAVCRTMSNVHIGEILINGQQFWHNTVFHQDCKDNGMTMLYYVNQDIKESHGGQTHIKVDDDVLKVAPRPGRICLFLGKLMHKGESFNADYTGLRSTIAYKIGRHD